MRNEWILLSEIKTQFNYIYYKFINFEEKKYSYFRTIIGDGFVRTAEIKEQEYNDDIKEYFPKTKIKEYQ